MERSTSSDVEVGVTSRGMSSIIVKACLAAGTSGNERICRAQRWRKSLTKSRGRKRRRRVLDELRLKSFPR